ncbi:CpsD/CapB family tyrosine-protein kinase [uncultured Enterococcus sp.]|uniref:CpsD/CapB family tyrosine-protein kinase n=1 Tax=uncultured Enterococcus sp. TaxID=167972 RepID=UPI00258EA052|nr:CpsD/CapB family tyrosine-protein kinase [uncultured Enterococcus sp.]
MKKLSKKQRQNQQTSVVSLITLADKASPVAEQYRTIRTNIQFASANRKMQTIVVTSAGAGEGKSTTTANLAIVLADAGQRVLLVDADMRKATVHKSFGLSNEAGLSFYLSSNQQIEGLAQHTSVANLSVLTAGPKPPNPSELLGSKRMDQFIEEACRLYDVILFDMPPIVVVTDAQIMASKVDGTLMVVREEVTRKDALMNAKKLLDMVHAHILGVVYNGVEKGRAQDYYYYGH